MDNKKIARELVGIAREMTAGSDDLMSALKESDKAWKTYQDYLTRADKPFKKMMEARNKLDYAMTDAAQSANSLSPKETRILRQNMAVAEEIMKTIDSFGDPDAFQRSL